MMGDDDSGYDAFFVGDLQDAYKCAVCHLALRKPVQVIECGHRFCECCFVKMKNYSESRDVDFCCPLDRLAIDPIKVFRDKGIERTVLDLHVKCSNFQKGCNWVQELMQLQRHLQSCPHEMVKCGNTECSKLVERCELSQHEKHCPILQQKISHSVQNLGAVVKKLSERVDECESQLTTKDDRLGMYENVLSENNKRIAFLEKKLADNAKNDRLEKNEFLGKIKQLEDRLRKIECLPKVAAIASSSNSPQIEAKAVDKKTTSSSMLGYQKVEEPRFKAFGAKDSANNNYMLSAFGDKPAEVVKKKPEVPKLPEKPQEDETKKAKIIHNYQSVQQNQVPMMQGQIQSQPVYIQNGQNPQIRMNMNGPRMAQFTTAQPFVTGGYQQNQQQGHGYQVQQPYGGQQQFQYLAPRGQYQQVYMVPQGGYPSNVVMQQQMPASQGQHIPGTRSFNQISATQLQPKKKPVIVLKDPTTGKNVTSEILKKKTERTTPSSGYSSTSSTPPLPQDDKKAKIQAAFAAQVAAVQSSFKSPQIESKAVDNR